MLRTTAAAVAMLALAGCAQSEMIVLRNPQTGEVKECRTNSGASFFPIAQTMIDNTATRSCAEGYQRAGFVRMN